MCNLWFSNFAVVNSNLQFKLPDRKTFINESFSIAFGFFNLNFAVILVQFSMFVAA